MWYDDVHAPEGASEDLKKHISAYKVVLKALHNRAAELTELLGGSPFYYELTPEIWGMGVKDPLLVDPHDGIFDQVREVKLGLKC